MEGSSSIKDDIIPSSSKILLHYLGPPGTYSHQVALEFAKRLKEDDNEIILKPSATIFHTFSNSIESQELEKVYNLALLPFENNSNGPVIDSYGLLHEATTSNYTLDIISEAYLPVNHSLLVSKNVYQKLKGDKDQVELIDLKRLDEISSHPQALGQCSEFIKENMRKDVELVEISSTGEASRQLLIMDTSEKMKASIASKVCTQEDVYDLVELFSNIQNSNGNTTRFLLCYVKKSIENEKGRSIDKETNIRQILSSLNNNSCRAIFHLTSKDITSRLLSNCLKTLSGSDLPSGKRIDCIIRKIDRSTIRLDDSKAEENGNRLLHKIVPKSEGVWSYTYLIEVDIKVEEGDNITDDEHSSKRIRTSSNLDSYKALIQAKEQVLQNLQQEAINENYENDVVRCIGYWIV